MTQYLSYNNWRNIFVYSTSMLFIANRRKEVHQVKKIYLSHIWKLLLAIHINFYIFFRYASGYVFVQFNYWQFDPINLLIHWLILVSRRFSQQVLSLNWVQMLPSYKVHNLPGQVKMRDTFYMQLFLYILHVFCIATNYIHR